MNFAAMNLKRTSFAWREPLANLLMCVYMSLIIFMPEAYEQWFRQPVLEETRLANQQAAVSVKFALLLLGLRSLNLVYLSLLTQ